MNAPSDDNTFMSAPSTFRMHVCRCIALCAFVVAFSRTIADTSSAVSFAAVPCAIQSEPVQPAHVPAPIRIGVLAHKGTETCRQMWQPTVDYLDQAIPGRQFELLPLQFEEVEPAVKNKLINFLICNPAIYVDLEVRYGITRIVTLRNRVGTQIVSEFGGVVFCRANRSDLRHLQDARGQRLAAAGKTSFGGWYMALREFRAIGIDPARDCSQLVFLDSHPAVVRAVLSGAADIGTVRTDTIERMSANGEIQIDDLRVIPADIVSESRPTFPYLHSTRLYPEWPLAELSGTADEISRELSVALLSMPADSDAALAAKCGGWSVCLNYTSVHDCLRELRLPPYEEYGRISWSDVWQQYWPWLIAITVSISALGAALLLLRRKQLAVVRVSTQNRLLLASVGEGICGIDVNGIVTFVNPAAETILGYTATELLGNNLHALTHHSKPDGRPYPRPECPIFRACHDGTVHQGCDEFFFHKDGRMIPISYSSRPIVDRGRISGAVICFQDITERKRSEHELQWKTAFLEAQTNSSLDGILVVDQQNRRLLSNEQLFAQWNVPQHIRDDLDDSALLNYVVSLTKHPEQFYAKVRYLFDYPDATSRDEIEFKNGMVLERYSSSVVGKDGHYYGRIWTFRDITKRKQAEEKLRESQQRLAIALEGAEMGEWHWDAVEDKRHFSDQTCALLSIDPVAFRGTAEEFFATVLPDDREAVHSALRRTLDQDLPYESEYRTVRPDGSVHFITARGKLLRSDDGSPFKLSGIIWDVTAQKQTEHNLRWTVADLASANKSLEKLNQVAESATRAKSEFLANMSHEIRTPIAAILGYADILLEQEDGCATREPVEVIKRNGEHLLELINNILDLSKVEAGKMQIEPSRYSPVQIVLEVMSLMRVRADAKQLKLEVDRGGPLPETVLIDPLRLRQVLVNLVGNAIKFTDQGTIRVGVRLALDSSPLCLRFDVTDTGMGMNEEQVGRLFQAFSQVDNSAARKFGGTGLGLAISKRLTEAMGGEIEVHSEPGKGSTFSVTIDPGPLEGIRMVENSEEALLGRPSTATVAISAKIELCGRVLLAEDGPDNQRLIGFLLKKAGVEVTAVENGQLAVEAALARHASGPSFDVILMDMQMPVMDGYTATQTLRGHGYAGPIIALTAHAMADDRQKCLDAGCDDYASKPIDRQRLLAIVAHWIAHCRKNNSTATTDVPSGQQPTHSRFQ